MCAGISSGLACHGSKRRGTIKGAYRYRVIYDSFAARLFGFRGPEKSVDGSLLSRHICRVVICNTKEA